jgi:hypothetical protein
MSDVVRRCPNCGTTRATPGECDACHEAQVRYFCTNHTPGLWLDARTCPKCGARFGDPARRPSALAPATPVRAPAPTPARTPPPASPVAPHPPYTRASLPDSGAGLWSSRERLPPADEEDLEPRPAAPMALWQQLLRAAVRARHIRSRAAPRRALAIGRGLGGCLIRSVLLMIFLFIALVTALFLFGGPLLRGFFPY